jgi:hypothetical protein
MDVVSRRLYIALDELVTGLECFFVPWRTFAPEVRVRKFVNLS